MGQAAIAMTTATGMGPLPDCLENMVGPRSVGRAFAAAGLPLALLENRRQKIPMAAMVSLFHEAEKVAADEVFGLRVGQDMKPGAYGLWTRYSGQGQTVMEALSRLSRTIGVHQSGGAMRVQIKGAKVEWAYVIPGRFRSNIRAHSEHVAPVMIAFLRPFLGSTWTPDKIGMPFPDDGLSTRRADLIPSDWSYSKDAVTLTFPTEMLKKQRVGGTVETTRLTQVELYAARALKDAQSLDHVVREIVALRLMDGHLDIDGAARLSGLSLRTFQRNLDRNGFSYSQLLTQVRKQRAVALLEDSTLSVMEIGFAIGFSDPGNFTRAFRAWTGISPSQFRKQSQDFHISPN